MTIRLATSLLALGVAANTFAQPARLVWSRNSSSSGVTLDTARDGLLDSEGNLVLVGASKHPSLASKGNITVFNRKTAVATFAEFTPLNGGSLEWRRIGPEDIPGESTSYVAVGTVRSPGSSSSQIYVARIRPDLTVIAETAFAANTYGGDEYPTDIGVDPDGNIYITGLARKNNMWQVWLAKTTTALSSVSLNFQKVDISLPTEPTLVMNMINGQSGGYLESVLIGFVGNSGATLRSYQPTGPLNYTRALGDNVQYYGCETMFFAGDLYWGTSWTEESNPGNPVSHGAIIKVNPATGSEITRYEVPTEPGRNTLVVTDMVASTNAARRVNTMFRRNGRTETVSSNETITIHQNWSDASQSSGSTFAGVTHWGDVVLGASREATYDNILGLASNTATRYSFNTPTYNLDPASMDRMNLLHLASGDIFNIRTDSDKMQVTCVRQAPIAITDSFQPKSGVTFRPLLPVTTNDRYAEGSGISIVQMPAHGTLTMGSNGFFNYKSTPGYTGPDSFRYRLTKAALNTSEATINLTVKP